MDALLAQLATERRRVAELQSETVHLVRAMGSLWADLQRALGRGVDHG